MEPDSTPSVAPIRSEPRRMVVGLVIRGALLAIMIVAAVNYEGQFTSDTTEAAVNRDLAALIDKGDGLRDEKVVRRDADLLKYQFDDGARISVANWLAQSEYASDAYDVSPYAVKAKKIGPDGKPQTNQQVSNITLEDDNRFYVLELLDLTRRYKLGGEACGRLSSVLARTNVGSDADNQRLSC